ncbi:MAG: sulfotransferase [Candidatus Thermoplasmatota archaeon]
MDFEELKKNSFVFSKTPLPGYNISNLLILLAQNKFSISLRYIPRLIYSFLISGLMGPFRVVERIKYDKKIKDTKIEKHPIFLLGYWRSGTTFLQNVISLDENLGYFDTFQAYLPSVFLIGEKIFKPLVDSSLPKKRPMDNADMDADLPQEDQYALGAFSVYSYYHGWCFPKNMDFYNKYVLMENVDERDIKRWRMIYRYLLKKATLKNNGKRLVLKNQDNTSKIDLLLDMFPKAKFVLIKRNPYDLYHSMMRFMRIVIPLYCVQNPPDIEKVEKSMFKLYRKMFKKYFRTREIIPKGNLVEIKYEDFVDNPLSVLEDIYSSLSLKGFKKSKRKFKRYIDAQETFVTHSYSTSNDLKEKILDEWGFVFERLGYQK